MKGLDLGKRDSCGMPRLAGEGLVKKPSTIDANENTRLIATAEAFVAPVFATAPLVPVL